MKSYYRLTTLAARINKFGKGYKAKLTPGINASDKRRGHKLTVTHGPDIIYEHDSTVAGSRNETAVRWADEQFSFHMMDAKDQADAGRPPKKAVCIALMDERGLKVTVKTRSGEDFTFKNVVQVEVER